MLCFIFVIALIVPSLAQEHGADTNNTIICTDPRAIAVGVEFFKCFDITVNNSIEHENKSCATSLQNTIDKFVEVANETCYNDTKRLRLGTHFLKITNYSLRNDAFKEFVHNGGVKCINAIRKQITDCVKNAIGEIEGADNKFHTLWKKTNLTVDHKSCNETSSIKRCTLYAIKNEENKCKYKRDSKFVSSLFDYTLMPCKHLPKLPSWPSKMEEELVLSHQILKDAQTTHVLLGLLLSLALLGILYVLFRDCRTNGRWKIFNEQFEMKQRRQSLVKNEVYHRD